MESLTAPYRRVANAVREDIRNGRYAVGDPIPSRGRLADEHDVSAMTVSNALRELKAEGLIAAVPGRGTYVTATPEGVSFTPVEITGGVFECDRCVALVRPDRRDRHAAWHAKQ